MRLESAAANPGKFKNSLSLLDGLVDVSAEEQVSASSLLDNIVESRLVDWEVIRVPSVDSGLVEIDNGHLDVGARVSSAEK